MGWDGGGDDDMFDRTEGGSSLLSLLQGRGEPV